MLVQPSSDPLSLQLIMWQPSICSATLQLRPLTEAKMRVALVSLTYASAIDKLEHFKRSKQIGAHFGMTPKRYQSGDKDVSGHISKIGDRSVRTVFYEAANVILPKTIKEGQLKSWGMRLAARAGKTVNKSRLRRACQTCQLRMLADQDCQFVPSLNDYLETARIMKREG